jgi:hypothetical protein
MPSFGVKVPGKVKTKQKQLIRNPDNHERGRQEACGVAGPGMHSAQLVSFGAAPNDPARHGIQEVDPVSGWKEPTAQGSHEVERFTLMLVPASHGRQVDCFVVGLYV